MVNESSVRQKVASGFIWTGIEQLATKSLALILSFLLIRMLRPEEFGMLAIVTSFVLIAEVLVNSGLGIALVQKYSLTREDENSIFFVNLILSLILYAILFLCAPAIGRFYQNDGLVPLVRVVSLCLILFSLCIVQEAQLLRKMAFKERFRINFTALLISGVIGIGMAWHGFGVWALAIQQLTKTAVNTCGLWLLIGWRPGLKCDFRSLWKMLKFGLNYMLATLLGKLCMSAYPLLIGKFFDGSQLGIFDRGKYYPQVIVGSVSDVFLRVMFPAFAKMQNDRAALRAMFSTAHRLIAFFIIPTSMVLAVTAPSFVPVVMGRQWIACVPLLQIFTLVCACIPLNMLCFHLVTSSGHSGQRLMLEIVQKFLELSILILVIRQSLIVLAAGMAVHSVLASLISVWSCRKLINYRLIDIVRDIQTPVLLSAVAGAVAFGISLVYSGGTLGLILQLVSAVLTYIGVALIFRVREITFMKEYFMIMIGRGRSL